MMWKLFKAKPMTAKYTGCDICSVTDDTSVSSSSSSVSSSISSILQHPTPPAKPQEAPSTAAPDMARKSKIAKSGLAPRSRPLRQVSKPFEAAALGAPLQKQEVPPPKAAPTALPPLPLGSQQALTRRKSLRRPSPPRIADNANIAKPTKQRRKRPPVKTIQFQSYFLTADTGDNSKKVDGEAGAGMSSSYLQLEIVYPACETAEEDDAETGAAFKTPSSTLAQLSIVCYAD